MGRQASNPNAQLQKAVAYLFDALLVGWLLAKQASKDEISIRKPACVYDTVRRSPGAVTAGIGATLPASVFAGASASRVNNLLTVAGAISQTRCLCLCHPASL